MRRKRLAKSRAYLKIFEFTRDPLDLFMARQTAIETTIDPEEATRAHMDIYSITHEAGDLEAARRYIQAYEVITGLDFKVTDEPVAELGDYFKLMGVFDLVFISGGLMLFGTLVER